MKKVYLAAPFSHWSWFVRRWRIYKVNKMAAKLMEAGYIVFSPLSHSYPISRHTKIDDQDHDFWLRQDLPFIAACDIFCVYRLWGWDKSRGILREIKEAARLGKERIHV